MSQGIGGWLPADEEEESPFFGTDRGMSFDEFRANYIDRPTWRQMLGNVIIRIGQKVGTTFVIE